MEKLLQWDRQLFLAINNGWQNSFLDLVMPLLTLFGDAWYLSLIVIPLLYFNDRQNFKKNIILFVVILLSAGVFSKLIKHYVNRPRPLKDMADLIASHQVYIHVIGVKLREFSFPSGHSFTAFSAATLLTVLYRRWAILFFSFAFLTGISRIYMGAHFPLDVLGGMVFGVMLTLAVCFILQKVCFKQKIPDIRSEMEEKI